MIEAKAINGRLRSHQQFFTGRQTPDEIATLLQQAIKPWGAKVSVIRCTNTDVLINKFSIGGFFDVERKRQAITLNVYFNEKQKKFNWNAGHRENFIFLASQILQHELIHKKQHVQRPADAQELSSYYAVTTTTGDQEQIDYMSEFDEIDAYAHDIALEIVHYYPGTDRFKILGNINHHRYLTSWRLYTKTFKDCQDWSQVRNRLLGKIYRWLPHIED